MTTSPSTFAAALVSPDGAAPAATDIYGPLIGSWSVAVTDTLDDGGTRSDIGEWHFSRVLDGRAVQDVWVSPPRSARHRARVPGAFDRFGSSIRVPLPGGREWKVIWLNPERNVEVQLIGRCIGDLIVQEGEQPDSTRLRWTFSNVSNTGFHWLGETSLDHGRTWRTQQQMVGTRLPAFAADHDDMIRSLKADGPHSSIADGASTFEWLHGAWELDCDIVTRDGQRTRWKGDWHFGWIVGGRMVQDALYFYPPGQPDKRAGGTSLRLYDTQRKEWNVVWFSPGGNFFVALKGGRVGERVVLHGDDADGARIRWTFDDIRAGSFHWLGEKSDDGGRTWWVEQEMHARRQA